MSNYNITSSVLNDVAGDQHNHFRIEAHTLIVMPITIYEQNPAPVLNDQSPTSAVSNGQNLAPATSNGGDLAPATSNNKRGGQTWKGLKSAASNVVRRFGG